MAARCPHCGAPMTLGSSFCLDCGARLGTGDDRDPWEREDHSSIRKNTGEQTYRKDQSNQRRHESAHQSHSTSKEAEEDQELRPHTLVTLFRQNAQQGKAERNNQQPQGMTTVGQIFNFPDRHKKKQKKPHGKLTYAQWKMGLRGLICLLVLVYFVFYLEQNMEANLFPNSGTTETSGYTQFADDASGGFSADDQEDEDFDYDADDYNMLERMETEENSDGSWTEIWYDSDGAVSCQDDYDASGVVQASRYYQGGELVMHITYSYNDLGDLIAVIYYQADGQRMEEDYFYNGQTNISGQVFYTDGEVTDAWGVDDQGGDLSARLEN